MNEPALLQGVLDAPDDDAPRLVYADWLEDDGQSERAELIRVQIELERLAPYDAGHARLAARASALLRRYDEQWRPPLPGWAADRTWDGWRRGFLDRVAVAARYYVSTGAVLCEAAPLRAVRLHYPQRWLATLAGSANLGLLPDLTLTGSLPDRPVEPLAASPHLVGVRSLCFDYTQVSDGTLIALARSPHATSLRALGVDGIACYDRRLTAAGTEALGHSANLPRLRSLQLEHCRIRGEAAEALFGSPLFERLTDLDLTDNAIGIAAVRALAAAPASGLRTLRLNSCDLRDAGAIALAASPRLAGLVSLDLANNHVGPDGARALAASPHLGGLRSLSLGRNRLGDEGFKALATSSRLTALTALDVSEQQRKAAPTQRGLEALLASPLAGRLVRLDLSRNALGDEGARRLARAAGLSRLEWLGVGEAKLSERGQRALLDSPHLAGLAAMRWMQEGDWSSDTPLIRQMRERMGYEYDD
jgi:uncharacterized protein (TIGR02996 family)